MQDLRGVSRDFFALNLRIGSADTRRQYGFALDDFAKFLGREPTTSDLSDDQCTLLTRHLAERRGLAAITANERVGRIRTLWTWLAKRGVVDTWPTFSRLPQEESNPEAWSAEELRAMFHAAGEMPGTIFDSPAGRWWQAWLLWLWNTGARLGESLALEWLMLDRRKSLAVIPATARKGRRKRAIYSLWPDTLAAMIALPRVRPQVFAWDRSPATYYKRFDQMLRRAGLPLGRRRKTQAIRCSHATWLAVSGQDPTAALMHSDPATTREHYLDRRFLVEPPRLFSLEE